MDYKRYSQVMEENSRNVFTLELDPVRVGLLHGAIRLMLMHPEVKERYSEDFKKVAGDIRTWCLDAFKKMGFTDEEIEALDSEFA